MTTITTLHPGPAAAPPARRPRGGQHRAAGPALPVRRLPRAAEPGDARSTVVLAALLAGLAALPDEPGRTWRQRLVDLLTGAWGRADVEGVVLVARAGVVAAAVVTALLLGWMRAAGRL